MNKSGLNTPQSSTTCVIVRVKAYLQHRIPDTAEHRGVINLHNQCATKLFRKLHISYNIMVHKLKGGRVLILPACVTLSSAQIIVYY